ncbi:MAG: glycosyltransferase, partial [Melioribacteraceae bacterium]|nr:glycosyltransferase [Melioribacteraceae bacterium]
MPTYDFLFSVIVPTYNRADEIEELIQSLSKQTLSSEKFEVIIIDDGSTDNTLHIIEEFQENSSLRISVYKQDHKGPGAARNFGMKLARGKYFIFIDSDCIADKDWLLAYENAVSNKEVAGFGGPDGVLNDFLPIQKAIDYSMTSFITTGGIRGHSKKKISKYYPRSFNMGVRSDIVDKIGGMGKLRHGQDIEFSNRILSTGEQVIKVAKAIVYHKRRISLKKFFKQVFNWGVARINLYKIDRSMLEPIHFLPAIATIASILLIFLTFILPMVFLPLLIIGILILLTMAIHGAIKYKDNR